MNIIMSQCNFSAATYAPGLDSVVNNVQVVATKPAFTLPAGNNAAVMGNDARALSGKTASVGAVIASFVGGMVMML
jgi:hypothetical protein